MKNLMMRRLSPLWGALALVLVQNLQFVTFVRAQTTSIGACVTEAYRSLSSSQTVEVCKNPTPFTAACVTEAYRSLSSVQTVEVCKNATADTGTCVTEAYRSLSSSQTVEVCRPSNRNNINLQNISQCGAIRYVRRLAKKEQLDDDTLAVLESRYCARQSNRGFIICNNTDLSVATAIGYYKNQKWWAEGWWNLDSGECTTVYNVPLTHRYYYVYAENKSAAVVWRGRYNFCVSQQAFTLAHSDKCGERKVGFRQVDVGNSNRYTYTLTR